MKKYPIGGRDFELRPLMLVQRKLIKPIYQKILAALKSVASVELDPAKGDAVKNIEQLATIVIELDNVTVSDDDSFEKFLATILVPAEAPGWDRSMIESNAPLMGNITEDVQAEVLQDFLARQIASKPSSLPQTPNLTNMSAPLNKKPESSDQTTL